MGSGSGCSDRRPSACYDERTSRSWPCPSRKTPDTVPSVAGLQISQILATTDFSESSVTAAKIAANLAGQFSASRRWRMSSDALTVPTQRQPLVQESDEMRLGSARPVSKRWLGSSVALEAAMTSGPRPPGGTDWLHRSRPWHATHRDGSCQRPRCFGPRPGSIAYRVLCSTTVPVLVVPIPGH